MNVNYDRVCRLCLSSRCELLPIFPTTSSDDLETPVLASKINDCVSVQISENDVLPTNVCRKCIDNVNNWHIFKTVCERTQNKLQSFLNKESNQLEEVKIKNEPLSDEIYDDGVVIDGSYPDSENATTSSKVQPEGPPILASLGLTPRSDKKYIDPRMDWQRVHAIFNIVQESDVIDSLQSVEECDVVHHSDHDSDSESELCNDSINDFLDHKDGYICKNGKILSKNPKETSAGTLSKIKQVMESRKRNLPTLTNCVRPKHAWQMLFTDDLLDLIVTSTNGKIGRSNYEMESTSISEIRTIIGILYYHAIMRATHQECSDLWHNEYGAVCIQNGLTYERFKFLLQNLSFDNEYNDSIVQFDIMKRMREVFEIFALNCRNSLNVGNLVVIDEIIAPLQGPCPFTYNIQSKENKNGFKIILLIDPVNFYVSNLDVITDRYFGSDDIVAKLIQHLAGTGRTVIMDSWFTSPTIINKLKNECNLYSIGALHCKDGIIPPLFLSHARKDIPFISGFLDKDMTVNSYLNNSKVINILTNDPKYYKRVNSSKGSAAALYKKYQPSVEVLEVLMHYYTTMQHTNDWTLSLFFMLLNIASINAQVIWSMHQKSDVVQRRLFIRELALSLMEGNERTPFFTEVEQKKRRTPSLPRNSLGNVFKCRKRCKLCIISYKRDRRTKQMCCKCGTFICREHTLQYCTNCVS